MSNVTLEDFFTLTELIHGLKNPSRAEELISVIQKQNYSTSDAEEIARQRLIVAAIIASTESADCLNQLIQFDMLHFLNQWLHEAAKSGQDSATNVELIKASFLSLEKLPLCKEKLISSGILATVRDLLDHKLIQIKERAQGFLERWTDKSFESSPSQTAVAEESCRVEELGTAEPSQKVGVESEVVDYSDKSSERPEKVKHEFDLNIDAVSNDLDCEPSLLPSNPLNLSVHTAVSASNGDSGIQTILSWTSTAAKSANALPDSEQKGNFAQTDLNMEVNPPSMDTHIELGLERAETIHFDLTRVEEKEAALGLLKLASSTHPSIINHDFNEEPPAFDSDPALIIDRKYEILTRVLKMRKV
ncbi:uncharacterized protein LOC110026081 [Phalaenopsis equestris]|uniref:uncharacterized protein LOC110026081 n=1 Tax=Phalaenopsis equestris TaxID=78828 RepID=UPI0009E1A92E|nr:uncharacterized protein LOC110026081 [Phalaenopsis equestris]XP_020582528.1 uncharacterized protein LOC110026081 [Phalaenopsis equestris]